MLIKMKTVITIFKPLSNQTNNLNDQEKQEATSNQASNNKTSQQATTDSTEKSNNKVSQTNSSGYNFDDDEDDVDTTNAQSKNTKADQPQVASLSAQNNVNTKSESNPTIKIVLTVQILANQQLKIQKFLTLKLIHDN